MGSVPGHPFFLHVIDALPQYNRNWLSPYITIMSSTGPLFLSLIWRHYNTGTPEPTGSERLRILRKAEYMGNTWSFFTHHVGNSWHKWDTQTILWMSRHWIELTFIGAIVVLSIFTTGWCFYRRAFLASSSKHAHVHAHSCRRTGPPFGYSIIRRVPLLRFFILGRRKDYIELANVDIERRNSLGRPS